MAKIQLITENDNIEWISASNWCFKCACVCFCTHFIRSKCLNSQLLGSLLNRCHLHGLCFEKVKLNKQNSSVYVEWARERNRERREEKTNFFRACLFWFFSFAKWKINQTQEDKQWIYVRNAASARTHTFKLRRSTKQYLC